MDAYDALVVGGGPAGSACAARLRAAGLDVLVLERARLPREKPCAGWITPDVLDLVGLSATDYRFGATLQPFRGFRVGVVSGPEGGVEESQPVSYGIRRCEFDYRLLLRSGAHFLAGAPVERLRRGDGMWIVDDAFAAPILVGAGGHFCPVARLLNGPPRAGLVAAEEVEFRMDARQRAACRVEPEIPEISFSPDLRGYGWCVRKGDYLNVGFGRRDPVGLPGHLRAYLEWQARRGRISAEVPPRFCGHAYRLREGAAPRLVDDGVVLVGDAAGVAFPESGEGIRPAIESGLLAAHAIVEAGGRRSRADLEPYARALEERMGPRRRAGRLPPALARVVARLVGSNRRARVLVIERWFLRKKRPPFALPAMGRPPVRLRAAS
ncbi:MAG TPA: NAD(P)/FAD-dependent oxidoreductase [Vicinamibacteria bacterium]|nr:NAD(P)/FAD-dependent oxidoreductase [Vicinamibacteria bacterium]